MASAHPTSRTGDVLPLALGVDDLETIAAIPIHSGVKMVTWQSMAWRCLCGACTPETIRTDPHRDHMCSRLSLHRLAPCTFFGLNFHTREELWGHPRPQ